MSEQPNIALTLSPEIVTPIVQAKIDAAVAGALGDSDRLIRVFVEQALDLKCDSEGKVNSYDSYNRYSWFQVVIGRAIRAAAKQALEKAVEGLRPLIEAEVKKQISSKKGIAQLVSSMIGSVENAASKEWRIQVDIQGLKES